MTSWQMDGMGGDTRPVPRRRCPLLPPSFWTFFFVFFVPSPMCFLRMDAAVAWCVARVAVAGEGRRRVNCSRVVGEMDTNGGQGWGEVPGQANPTNRLPSASESSTTSQLPQRDGLEGKKKLAPPSSLVIRLSPAADASGAVRRRGR